MATEKVVNYTDEMVERLVSEYEASPTRDTVNALAAEFKRSERSVIAKLSTLGIYQTPARTTKSGTPIIRKEELVASVNEALNGEFPSLVKANKQDLTRLVEALGVTL